METLSLDLNKRYTFADYLTWFDDKRRELFEGFIKLMSPAPTRNHQEISRDIFLEIEYFLKKKKCKVYHAPFDVRFPNDNEKTDDKIFTVLQPDICIICDLSKLDEKGCIGAPDFIAEIVSPSSLKNDLKDKFEIYEKSGVREYWIIRPDEKTVTVFINNNLKYEFVKTYTQEDKASVNIFNGELIIDLEDVFKDID